jgi:signal peptidase I
MIFKRFIKTKQDEKEETKTEIKRKKDISTFREYTEMIIEVLVMVFFINTFLLQSQTIPTSSMEDNMLIGDHLLVNKIAYAPSIGSWDRVFFPRLNIARGMIITFKGPPEMEKDYVKRVIGLPGETVRIENKKVYIDGKLLDEPYVFFKGGLAGGPDTFPMDTPHPIDALGQTTYLPFYLIDGSGNIDPARTVEFCDRFKDCVILDTKTGNRVFKVPEGYYFCMGDNRDNSYDCRFWGPVPQDYILGKPWRIFWSYESSTQEYLTPGILHKIKDLFDTVIHFFTRTRWERTFKKF